MQEVWDSNQAQHIVQVLVREPVTSIAADLMLDARPSTQPSRDIGLDGPIGVLNDATFNSWHAITAEAEPAVIVTPERRRQ